MDYRNDLEASRLRINTLEAKLEETKASLNAREVELAECQAERDRLRQAAGGKTPPSRTRYIAVGMSGFVLGCLLCFVTSGVMTSSNQPAAPTAAPAPTTTYKERSSEIQGTARVPPPAPLAPRAVVSGQAGEVTPTPPAVVSGQTGEETTEEKTIQSVIEDARPKIRACYREEAKAHPDAHGSVNVQVVIEPSGKVSRTKLETLPYVQPWWSNKFETCVVGVYRELQFPNDTGTKVTARGTYFLSKLDLAF